MILGLSILFSIFFIPLIYIYSEFFIRPKYVKNSESVNFINRWIYLKISKYDRIFLTIIVSEFLIMYMFSKITNKQRNFVIF